MIANTANFVATPWLQWAALALAGCAVEGVEPATRAAPSVTILQVPALSPLQESPDHAWLQTYSMQLPARVCDAQDIGHFMMWSGPYRDIAPFFWGWPVEMSFYAADVEVQPVDDSNLPVYCSVRCGAEDGESVLEFAVAEGFNGRARCTVSMQDDVFIEVTDSVMEPSASVRVDGMVALDGQCQRFYGLDQCQQWQLTHAEDHWTRRDPGSPPVSTAAAAR